MGLDRPTVEIPDDFGEEQPDPEPMVALGDGPNWVQVGVDADGNPVWANVG